MEFTTFGIGFVAGGVVVALLFTLVYSGKVKFLSLGKEGFKIEGSDLSSLPASAEGQDHSADNIKIPVSGRWLTKIDKPGLRFPSIQESIATPATVRANTGEVFKFVADLGFTDMNLNDLLKLAQEPRLRYLGFHKCIHLSSAQLARVSEFKHLWDLDLSYTKADDAVLDALCTVTTLRLIDLRGCAVTTPAVARLTTKLPHCRVIQRA